MTTTDHQRLTDEQIADIEARANAATPGPWGVGNGDTIGLGIENDGYGGFAYDVILAELTPDRERQDDPNTGQVKLGTVKADAEFIAHAREDVPALLANLAQARRGAQELGKSVVFFAELIKDAYLRGADDPIDALHMLGNVLAEISEDEDGLSADEFNRVQQALRDRRAGEERAKAERDAAERDAVAAAVRRDTTPTT